MAALDLVDGSGTALSDDEAAAQLATLHREIAATLPVNSETRALILRCAGHWSRIAGGERPFGVVDTDES